MKELSPCRWYNSIGHREIFSCISSGRGAQLLG
nr:MAG TPA: hypothetical protein [Caudoviricetes sp.]